MRHRHSPPRADDRFKTSRQALWVFTGTLLASASMSAAQDFSLSDDRLGTRTAPLLLLTRHDIQADLNLSGEQVASALQTIRALYTRAEALRGQPDTPQVIASRRAIDQAQTDWIQTQLSVEQQTRLVQLDLQWEGPSAVLTRPMVAETLGLTEAQRRTLAKAIATRRQERAERATRPDDAHQLAEITLSTLDEDQRARWLALLGPPLAVERVRSHDPAVQTTSSRSSRSDTTRERLAK